MTARDDPRGTLSAIPVFYRPEMVAKVQSFSPSVAKPRAVVDDWKIQPGENAPASLDSYDTAPSARQT